MQARKSVSLLLMVLALTANAGPLRDWLAKRQTADALADNASEPAGKLSLPPGTRVLRDVAYGSDPRQAMDIYAPDHAKAAPMVVMVHGGGWAHGDKAAANVVQNKLARWLPRGIVFVSVNYRLLPEAAPAEQARDVARALAYVQAHASDWGGAADKVVLMGHSAGAHLVALLSSDPTLARAEGVQRWLGTVSLDSAALDVEAVMSARHLPLYDRAFGRVPSSWQAVSPMARLSSASAPMLAVCSSRRRLSCPEAQRFADKARALGVRAQVLPQDLTHADVNATLGLAGAYTDAVERFMAGLDAGLAAALGAPNR
jgi:acetyl esterase/lipase